MMGILALGPKESKLPYSPLDMRFLYSVGIQTGLALEVSELAVSLAQEAAQKERVQREIEIAREVQERLFPQAFPVLNGATLAGACRPALQVGGDYYDVIQLEDGIVLAVGDVAGKGVSASLLMASLQAALRGITLGGVDNLAGLMCKLNHLIYESSSSSRYATFFLAVYNPRSNELRYVNAGHNPPLLLRRTEDGSLVRRRLAAGGMVLGLIPDVRYLQESLALQPGDMLLGYTDGITEAMTSEEEEWGEDRAFSAAEAAYDATAAAIVSTMFGAVDDFTAVAPQHDDMTLLVLKLERSTAIS